VIFQRLAGQRGLIRSSAVVFAGNSTARLLGFLFSVVAARVLGTQDFGRFAYGLTVASIAAILVTNAPRGLSRFLAREDGDRRQQDNYFSNWLIVVALTFGVSAVLLGPISILAGLSGWMIPAVGANLLGVAAFETYREGQRGLRRFSAMVIFYVAANLIQLLTILLAASLGWRSPPLFLTIYGLSSLAALALMQQARPIALSFLREALAWRRILSIVRFVRPLVFQTVFYAIWSGADIVLVGRILGPTATGNYAVAKTLVTVLALAPSAIGIVTGPEVARLSQQGQHRLWRFVTVALVFTGAVTVPIAVGLVWFKQPIILLLFGSKYPLASRPLTVLAVGMTLYCFSLVLESLWVGLGHPRIVAIASGLAMVCTVSLGLILIPQIADMGAAIAYAAGSAAQLAIIGSFTAWALYSGSIMRAQYLPDRGILES
jgi:O-antigen/teichoic acid export membrane protein